MRRSNTSRICAHRRPAASDRPMLAAASRCRWGSQPDSRSSARSARTSTASPPSPASRARPRHSLLSRLHGMPNFTLLTQCRASRAARRRGLRTRIAGVRLADGRRSARRASFSRPARCTRRACWRATWSAAGLDATAACGAQRRPQSQAAPAHRNGRAFAVAQDRSDPQDDGAHERALPHSSVQPLGFDGELIGTLMPKLRAATSFRARSAIAPTASSCRPKTARIPTIACTTAGRWLPTYGLRRARDCPRGARASQCCSARFQLRAAPHRLLDASRSASASTAPRTPAARLLRQRSAPSPSSMPRARARHAGALCRRRQRPAAIEPRESVAHDLRLGPARGERARAASCARTPGRRLNAEVGCIMNLRTSAGRWRLALLGAVARADVRSPTPVVAPWTRSASR